MAYIVVALLCGLLGALIMVLVAGSSERLYTKEDVERMLEDRVFWYREYVKLEKKTKYWKGFHKREMKE